MERVYKEFLSSKVQSLADLVSSDYVKRHEGPSDSRKVDSGRQSLPGRKRKISGIKKQQKVKETQNALNSFRPNPL